MLISLVANHADGLPIRGAVTVTVPIVPTEAPQRRLSTRNKIRHAWLLWRIKEESTAPGAYLAKGKRAKTILDYDDRSSHPETVFAGASDYYAPTAGARIIRSIRPPISMIHTRNDS